MGKNDDLDNMLQQVTRSMQKPIRPDAASMWVMQHENTAYDALKISQAIDEQFQEIAERSEQRDAAIQRTAQESIEHTRLLEKQLQELQAQNEMLKAEAEINRAEVEASRKAAKKARKLTIAAFVLSIVFPIASIVASVLIARFI